ncbi:MAG: hypothetical protein FWB77_03210 [Treponema sp.]|nr:hypothetical protein [Treponema sp.]
MKRRDLIIILAILPFLFAACGKSDGIVQKHFKDEKDLFGTYVVEFDIYLENVNYSKKTAGLIERLIYSNMGFDDYIANAQNKFIGPVTNDDFPPLTGGDGEAYFYKSFFNESYKIINHNKSFIVIEYNEYYYYTGMAHGNYRTNYFVIDISQEKILDVSDLMNPVDEDSLKELITNEYEINYFLRQNIWPPDTININAGNVVLLWNTYTITPYSDGLIGLVLYEDKYLTDKGKALQALAELSLRKGRFLWI